MGGCWSPCCCKNASSRSIRILLVGLDNAGKTTALKGLAGESTENIAPSIGFSFVVLHYKGHRVQVYDLGGGVNIRGIWSKYFTDVHGIIFVVDASALDRVSECRTQLENLVRHNKLAGKPLLLLANKQDLPGALDELDLVEQLGLETLVNQYKCPTSVETCAAVLSPDPAVSNGYKWLLDAILKDFAVLDARVEADCAEQREEEERILEERRQRVEKLRQERDQQNGVTSEPEGDFNSNPFRPIAELTGRGVATPGTKLILVQQSPPQAETFPRQPAQAVVSPTIISPNGQRERLSAKGQKSGFGLFGRNNKTAPMPPSSPPAGKPTLPPLRQSPCGLGPAEPVPWMRPVLPSSGVPPPRTNSAHVERAWGLDQELDVTPAPDTPQSSHEEPTQPSSRITPAELNNGF